jgi:hypothetical protein
VEKSKDTISLEKPLSLEKEVAPKDFDKIVEETSEMILKEEELLTPPQPLKLLDIEIKPQDLSIEEPLEIEAVPQNEILDDQTKDLAPKIEEIEAQQADEIETPLSFEKRFYSAPKGYYTIELGNIPNQEKDAFIKRFVLGEQYTTISKKGKTRIFLGIFESIEKAREHKFNLHPKIIDKVWLYRIDRIER